MVATRLSYPAKRKNFFTLEVNKKNCTDAALAELLGSRTFDGDVTKDLVVFRDPTSEFKDSVRVETENGHLVGWTRTRHVRSWIQQPRLCRSRSGDSSERHSLSMSLQTCTALSLGRVGTLSES
jgi:hypothetical protein